MLAFLAYLRGKGQKMGRIKRVLAIAALMSLPLMAGSEIVNPVAAHADKCVGMGTDQDHFYILLCEDDQGNFYIKRVGP